VNEQGERSKLIWCEYIRGTESYHSGETFKDGFLKWHRRGDTMCKFYILKGKLEGGEEKHNSFMERRKARRTYKGEDWGGSEMVKKGGGKSKAEGVGQERRELSAKISQEYLKKTRRNILLG